MSSPVRHVCEHTSWYIFVLTAAGGGLVDLGGVYLTGDCDDEHEDGEETEAVAAAAF